MVLGLLVGFAAGVVITGVVFIVFGKNNKNKIAAARTEIISLYEKADAAMKEKLQKVEGMLKK